MRILRGIRGHWRPGFEAAFHAGSGCSIRALLAASTLGLAFVSGLAQDVSAPRQTAQVDGVVRDSAGKPVAGASVVLERQGGATPEKTATGEDGRFSLPEIQPGTYGVKVEKTGFRGVEDSFQVAAAEKKRCEFVLQTLVSLSSASTPSSVLNAPALDDKPTFTVAGVTDWGSAGGHGSDVPMRTGESLAKDAMKLEPSDSRNTPSAGYRGQEDAAGLTRSREDIDKKLASEKLAKQERAELLRARGDVDEKLRDPLGAVQAYQQAAELDGSEANYFAWGAELLLHRAVAPATEVLEKGVRLHSSSARMLAALGAALYTSGAVEDAAQRLCLASDLQPANAAPYLFLGKMQESSAESLPCAEAKLARFASNEPGNARADYYYALAVWKSGRESDDPGARDHALDLLKKATTLDPTLDVAYVEMGNVYLAGGNLVEAMAAYQKAAATNPVSSQAHYRLGLTYKRAGEDAKARQEFELFRQLSEKEAAATEKERRELLQFVVVLREQPATR